jgi:diketogulonate reductase-like aldo/keto reductase
VKRSAVPYASLPLCYVPLLLYGTAWKKDDTAGLVSTAIRLGFRGIDTACQPKHYHEPGVGEGIADALSSGVSRSDLYLQSKFTSLSGQDPKRIPYDQHAPLGEQVRQSLDASLRNLRTDYLDALLLHSPFPRAADTLTAWQAFEALADAGHVRQLGLSNCYRLDELQTLYDAARIKPTLLQNRFYAATGYDRDIRAFCKAHHIVYQSFWTLTANPTLLAHPQLLHMSATHHRTPAQILFRYLTQQGIVPLTGTRDLGHMRADLAIVEFELDERECRELGTMLI